MAGRERGDRRDPPVHVRGQYVGLHRGHGRHVSPRKKRRLGNAGGPARKDDEQAVVHVLVCLRRGKRPGLALRAGEKRGEAVAEFRIAGKDVARSVRARARGVDLAPHGGKVAVVRARDGNHGGRFDVRDETLQVGLPVFYVHGHHDRADLVRGEQGHDVLRGTGKHGHDRVPFPHAQRQQVARQGVSLCVKLPVRHDRSVAPQGGKRGIDTGPSLHHLPQRLFAYAHACLRSILCAPVRHNPDMAHIIIHINVNNTL